MDGIIAVGIIVLELVVAYIMVSREKKYEKREEQKTENSEM